jgi:hypothetical protein
MPSRLMPCVHPRARLPEYHVNELVLVPTQIEEKKS